VLDARLLENPSGDFAVGVLAEVHLPNSVDRAPQPESEPNRGRPFRRLDRRHRRRDCALPDGIRRLESAKFLTK
jgi:hypothetical protein